MKTALEVNKVGKRNKFNKFDKLYLFPKSNSTQIFKILSC